MSRFSALAVLGLVVLPCSGPAAAAERQPSPRGLTDSLRACPDGGFALPGSRTCIRLSGTVETETVLRSSAQTGAYRRGLSLQQQAHGRLSLDVRTPTELGPLRVYTSVRVQAAPEPDVLRR